MSQRQINSIAPQQFWQTQRRPDPVKQLRGKLNRENGKHFEELIDAACEWYASSGEAEIEKTPEAMKIIKRLENNRFIACFLKKAQPDYKGTLMGGRSVVFEAKYTDSNQMEQNRITDVQERALNRHERMGAACFVVIGFDAKNIFRIPWADWKDMKRLFGRKYVQPGELGRYRIDRGIRNGILLFLD